MFPKHPSKSIEDDLRPISLTSQVSKIMESFTLDSLLSQIIGNLDNKQFALPKKSGTNALVYLMHQIHVTLDRGHCSARLFFADFEKAFDLVDHNVIIAELKNLGALHPAITRWIKSFLTSRRQCVKIGNAFSSWKENNGGLPQGTKLGPLLFVVLINSRLVDWQGRIKYVDDTTALEIISRCSESLLPKIVDGMCNYAVNRGMELNPKKCKEMKISFLKYDLLPNDPIYISGKQVEKVQSFKLLGVVITNDLTWNNHVNYIIKKANSRLYALRQLKKAGLNHRNLLLVYCSFVRSCLEYASPVWSDLTAELSNLIESIQRRALRIIHPSFSYEDALVCTGLETLSERRHNCCLKFIENTRSEVYPGYNPLANILRQNNNIITLVNMIIILEHREHLIESIQILNDIIIL